MIYYNFSFKYIFFYSHIFLNIYISEIKKSYTFIIKWKREYTKNYVDNQQIIYEKLQQFNRKITATNFRFH